MENSDDDTLILPSQLTQTYDPWVGLTQECEEIQRNHVNSLPVSQEKRTRRKPRIAKKKACSLKSHVISKASNKGVRLIQIKIIDLTNEPANECSDEEDNVVISAQYVVSDAVDEIMDMSESVIRKISKKLCNDNF